MSIPPIVARWVSVAGVAVGVAGGLAACAGRASLPAGAGSPVRVGYLGAVAYSPNTLTVPESALRVGSLSGLAFDRTSGRWIGASDDVASPRLLWLDVSVATGQPVVTPKAFLELTATADPASREALARLDMESIVVLPDGSFALTNEGHTDPTGLAHQPALLHVSRAGVVTSVVQPRAHFAIGPGGATSGVRHNLGFEGLALMPDGRLVAGLEQPLLQDGPVSDAAAGGLSRLVEFLPRGDTWIPGREWAYRLDPTPRVAGYARPCADGENGLSELFALDEHRVLALERACLVGEPGAPAFNPVRLYELDVRDADDVAGSASLAGLTPRLVRKRLVADLTSFASRMPPALALGSNFEGIALGPPSRGARRTLLLVSDDNFRPTQTLAFLWLSLQN